MKIHVAAVNTKSKKILSLNITDDERVHDDSKVLPKLVDNITKSKKNITVGKIIAQMVPLRQ